MTGPGALIFVLKPSRIHGVGVFTRHALRKGTSVERRLFGSDYRRARPVDHRYPYATKRWAPRDYHRMAVGWFLNHSDRPNLDGRTWRTLCYLRPGEELTVNYGELA
jgi:SET domain-containing protein